MKRHGVRERHEEGGREGIMPGREKKHFVYANEEVKAEKTCIQAGHLGPVNPPSVSLPSFPFPSSPCVHLCTWSWQPRRPRLQYERWMGRGGRDGVKQHGRQERQLAKRSISKWSWQQRQNVFPTIAEPSSHCKFSITERIHADTGRRMCTGMGTGI